MITLFNSYELNVQPTIMENKNLPQKLHQNDAYVYICVVKRILDLSRKPLCKKRKSIYKRDS